MTAKRFSKSVVAGISVLVLVSCDVTSAPSGNSFQSKYTSARTALEKGNYETANRLYGSLLGNSGPLEDRIRLELSHSHLRAGQFNAAAELSGQLAEANEGTKRSAALAVRATALHEMGLAFLAKGDLEEGKRHLQSADKAFEEVLSEDPKLDPLGSLAGRKASIAARLRAMR